MQYKRRGRCEFNPWIRKTPWRRKWQPTPVFLSGISHGQKCLVDYSPCAPKESVMAEHTHTHTHIDAYTYEPDTIPNALVLTVRSSHPMRILLFLFPF